MIAELYKATLSQDGHTVCSDLSFVAHAGERVALVGGNPADASLVLQAMLGMYRLDSGWVCFDGEPMLPRVAARFRHEVAYMPRLFDMGDISMEEVALAMYGERLNKCCQYRETDVVGNLARLGVSRESLVHCLADMDAATSQRALMALAFLFERPVALMDNPTSCQDECGRAAVIDYIGSSRFGNVATIIATDDTQLIAVCDKVVNVR